MSVSEGFTQTIVESFTEHGILFNRSWILGRDGRAIQVMFVREMHERDNSDSAPLQELEDAFTFTWSGAGVNYHSPVALQDETEPAAPCPFIEGGMCFSDGSDYRAKKLVGEWLEFGCNDDIIWAAAEEEYRKQFGEDGDSR
ncbi:hypothetical protein OG339_48460 (plasmid) [Streptosporangium sp. NBC_01495]|uniref:hypothetical protein n=1 Tax=Streptosporangium sp. NBC_01495 TaxID=2903899 RepID=UPI002E349BE3|nr:hypothetical protein [Streptosporangium sp. NBC_01495]